MLRPIALIFLILLLSSSAPSTHAQSSGGGYTLRKFVIAGGIQAQGSPFSAITTVGQPLTTLSTGGNFRLQSGFHARRQSVDRIFGSGFEF
jgi:hypothetical protein